MKINRKFICYWLLVYVLSVSVAGLSMTHICPDLFLSSCDLYAVRLLGSVVRHMCCHHLPLSIFRSLPLFRMFTIGWLLFSRLSVDVACGESSFGWLYSCVSFNSVAQALCGCMICALINLQLLIVSYFLVPGVTGLIM
jgi:hypothetical protein